MKRAERESKNKVSTSFHRCVFVFLNERFAWLFSVKIPPDRAGFPFLALTVFQGLFTNCAPDKNDRPSEQTITFKLQSLNVPVYITALTRT